VVIMELGVNVGMMLEGVVTGIPAAVTDGSADVANASELGRADGATAVVVVEAVE